MVLVPLQLSVLTGLVLAVPAALVPALLVLESTPLPSTLAFAGASVGAA